MMTMKRMRSNNNSPVQSLSKRKKRHSAFPLRLYDMLESAEELGYDHVISWMPDGKSFKIHVDGTRDLGDERAIVEALQRTFNITRYRSFLRQLQLYGFERTYKGPHRGQCKHELFVRGRRDLLLEKSVEDFQPIDDDSKSNPSQDGAVATNCPGEEPSTESLFLQNDSSNYWMPSCAFQGESPQSSLLGQSKSQSKSNDELRIPTAFVNLIENYYDTGRFHIRNAECNGNTVLKQEQMYGAYYGGEHYNLEPLPIVEKERKKDWRAFETEMLRTAL